MTKALENIVGPMADTKRAGPLSLSEAIRRLSAESAWAFLMEAAGGNESDVLELSGRHKGRFLLLHEIAKGSYAERERQLYSGVAKTRSEVIAAFDAKRRSGLALKGLTAASPPKRVIIPAALPLDYDFANNTASSRELIFYGVTLAARAMPAPAKVDTRKPAVPRADLRKFCEEEIRRYMDAAAHAPAMDQLEERVRRHFPQHRVGREQVRALHRELLSPQERRSGPRGKPK